MFLDLLFVLLLFCSRSSFICLPVCLNSVSLFPLVYLLLSDRPSFFRFPNAKIPQLGTPPPPPLFFFLNVEHPLSEHQFCCSIIFATPQHFDFHPTNKRMIIIAQSCIHGCPRNPPDNKDDSLLDDNCLFCPFPYHRTKKNCSSFFFCWLTQRTQKVPLYKHSFFLGLATSDKHEYLRTPGISVAHSFV